MRRRVGLFLFCGLVLPLIVTANASAQGATLELTPKQGPAGTDASRAIRVQGSGFSRVGPHIEGVRIRLNRRDAPPLRPTVNVDTAGRFDTTVFIPDGTAPGEYLVIATQQSLQGRHLFNTPGRAKFKVTAGSAGAAAVAPGGGTSQTVVVLGTLMLALVLAAGGTLAVRRLRTSNRPLGS